MYYAQKDRASRLFIMGSSRRKSYRDEFAGLTSYRIFKA